MATKSKDVLSSRALNKTRIDRMVFGPPPLTEVAPLISSFLRSQEEGKGRWDKIFEATRSFIERHCALVLFVCQPRRRGGLLSSVEKEVAVHS